MVEGAGAGVGRDRTTDAPDEQSRGNALKTTAQAKCLKPPPEPTPPDQAQRRSQPW
ncbi:MAG: hypothetical protein ACFB4J_10495 [Elainellaceae cyanobacterium]